MRSLYLSLLLVSCFTALLTSYLQAQAPPARSGAYHNDEITVGAERMDLYLPLLEGRRVALAVNQTARVRQAFLADTLLKRGVDVRKIFAPEHGFRGTADRGSTISDGLDEATGVPVVSIYGSSKKPAPEQLIDIDIIIFDMQDVGARFFTYISSMHYIMEAAAEQGLQVMVLDRPNPNGHLVAGPVLEPEYRSFVGMHPVPIVHGMTVGEYAGMINGERWLKGGLTCDLEVITCDGWDHTKFYRLPVKPSPNLPNMRSVYLYPFLCLFEGTDISVGRGTTSQFQVIGSPKLDPGAYPFQFTPVSMTGATRPLHEDAVCQGLDFSRMNETVLRHEAADLAPMIYKRIYLSFPDKDAFFLENNFFDKLAGSNDLREAILQGRPDEVLHKIYHQDLSAFLATRSKYLLYPDFE